MNEFVNLYRHVLKLHRLLPAEMRVIGDNYVKTEFRLHRSVREANVLETFYSEWSKYAETLLNQVSHDFETNSVEKSLGSKLELKRLSEFNDDQLFNLMELRKFALNQSLNDKSSETKNNKQEK